MPVTINGTTGETTPATVYSGSTSGSITVQAPAVAGTNTITLPAATDTIVTLAAAQTLTNKNIDAGQLTGSIARARMPTGSIVQIVTANKTDTFSTSSTTYTDLTGLSVSITPTSSSNKILVFFQVVATGQNVNYAQIVRNSTAIGIGDAASNRVQATVGNMNRAGDSNLAFSFSNMYLDSPATTSATTYKIQVRTENGTNPVYVNRTIADTDSAVAMRTLSNITVMEVVG